MDKNTRFVRYAKKIFHLLERRQKQAFALILLIMAVSAGLSQFTPKAIGWLTDDILRQDGLDFLNILPVLFLILIVTVVNELLKIGRRIMVEDVATKTEKKARGLVIASLLRAPLAFFKDNMTGNIHGRLNRCLDGTVKLEKLIFMDLAPAVFKMILNDLALTVRRGMFLGIAGPSGCGKSSLIKAICKLENYQGEILIDGKDLRLFSRKELSKTIALVPQNPFLIAGTIYENICYGLERQPMDEEVRGALQKSCLQEFVDSLPEGVHTAISEGGGNLSGGQRQRVAIARIFLRRPKILILDEATSALDNTSKRTIQHEIERLVREQNMTVISIAHRLTTLKNADRIIVMDGGAIIQSGTYQELIEREGIFSDMYHGKLK